MDFRVDASEYCHGSAVTANTAAASHKMKFRSAIIDASTIVRRAVTLNAPHAVARGLEVHMDMLAPLVVSGDARLLVEAIADLVAVVVHQATGPVSCLVRLNGGNVTIDVGAKVKREANAKIAGNFFSISGGGKAETLVNLDIRRARMIVERHGGAVSIASSVEVGAYLKVILPGRLA